MYQLLVKAMELIYHHMQPWSWEQVLGWLHWLGVYCGLPKLKDPQ